MRNPKFEAAIRERIGQQIDTKEVEKELEDLRKHLRQLNGTKTGSDSKSTDWISMIRTMTASTRICRNGRTVSMMKLRRWKPVLPKYRCG